MTASQLDDAFAHHVWATDLLIEACSGLTPEQLSMPVLGTYGSIIGTLRHVVASDCWYLTFFPGTGIAAIDEEAGVTLEQLRSVMKSNGAAWKRLLSGEMDPEADVVEKGDGWEFHSPVGFRLAQLVHHGTDHRSQICTALTSMGIEPPGIDLWAYGEATGRTRAVDV